jgi:hypothetical protein
MNAINYRVNIKLSELDFPAINGLGSQIDFTQTDPPFVVNNKVVLIITKALILKETYTNKEYEVFRMQSKYEFVVNDIKAREDIYEFYKDATLGLSEAYQYARTQLPDLPNISFSSLPIENYQKEIDGVFSLLYREN